MKTDFNIGDRLEACFRNGSDSVVVYGTVADDFDSSWLVLSDVEWASSSDRRSPLMALSFDAVIYWALIGGEP